MTQYHYATVDALAFLQLARVQPSAACPDAYIADDANSRTVSMLVRKGYRFVCIADGLALFEKQLTLEQRHAVAVHVAANAPIPQHLTP